MLRKLLLLNSILLVGFTGATFFIFCLMWESGDVAVFEDIIWIRLLETILSFVVTAIGLGSLLYALFKE